MRRNAWPGLVVLVVLSAGCGGQDTVATPGVSRTPVTAPPSLPIECPDGVVEAALCRFLDALHAGELPSLSEGELEVAGAVGDELPVGSYVVDECSLVGDVTVACQVTFASSPEPLGFHVVPVNADYSDGELITPDGEEVRYEVVDYLGIGERGIFRSQSEDHPSE